MSITNIDQPTWKLVEPGLIELVGTSIRIRYDAEENFFRIESKGKRIFGKFGVTLDSTKDLALYHVREMIEMGIEP